MKATVHKTQMNLFRRHTDFKGTSLRLCDWGFCSASLNQGGGFRAMPTLSSGWFCSDQQESVFHDTEYAVRCVLVVRRLPNIPEHFHAKHKCAPPPPPHPRVWHFRGNGRQGHHCFTVWLTMKQVCIDCSIIQICPNTDFIPALIHQTFFLLLVLKEFYFFFL